jgi:predicted ATPase/class 3 adenylate cyclase
VSLPTGTVTFLFTDIQGSTRLTESLGDAWPAVLERHLAILRAAVTDQEGIEFGTEGDALFAVFGSAPRAVAAAVAAQRALNAEPWSAEAAGKVRMGLHTGEGHLSGGTYVGLDVHRVARITSAGHGGQVVISAATRMLVEGSLPSGVALQDLGEHRLKDLSRPERLAMAVIEGLPSEFPPLRTVDAIPNNLPTQLTTFLGRSRELVEAGELLTQVRLLTLTGPGGTGKTRLSLQLAAEALDRYADGVYFVPLGALTEAELVIPAIAQAVGIVDAGGKTLDGLAGHLSGKQLLLVLDNFEQVIDAAADINELLTQSPAITILVSSRSPLRVYGEHEYPVPPLSLPDPTHLPDADTLAQYGAVALFVERAMAVSPGFAVTATNAPAIAEICVRLDGLPLAIELAAARVRALSPEAILSRLGHRLTLLSGGARDLPERQQTLRGAIDWSHDLLDETDRRIFARLSVFGGGADLTAVEAVVFGAWPEDSGPPPDALDALTAMVERSLLVQEASPSGEPRYRMLETIREYAAERLAESGEADALRARHAQHFLEVATALSAEAQGNEQREVLDAYERDHDNLRAALNFAVAENRGELAQRLLSSTWRFWQIRGHLAEARERAERILALPDAQRRDEVRLRALDAAGSIAYWQADMVPARRWYEEERALAAELGDARGEADAIYNLSFTYSLTREDAPLAGQLAADARDRYRALGDRHAEARALWAIVNSFLFDMTKGESGELSAAGEEAIASAQAAIPIFREMNDHFMLGWSLYTYGLLKNIRGEAEGAREALRESLGLFQETNDVTGYALVLDGFASLEWAAGERDRAMKIAGAAAAISDVAGGGLAQRNREIDQFFPQELLSEAALAEAYQAGQHLSAEEAVRLALREDEVDEG